MRKSPVSVIAAAAFAAVNCCATVSLASEDHGSPDFVHHMSQLQYFTHKLGLAISAQNARLQGYYLHEVEETIKKVAEVENHKGIEVARLVETLLEPAFLKLEQALDAPAPGGLDEPYEQLLDACNTCHEAAAHGYIRIERNGANPYLQSFAPGK
jgi:hypothetical protein